MNIFFKTAQNILKKEIIQVSSFIFISRVSGAVCGLLFNIILVRSIGGDTAGLYYLVLSVSTLATGVCLLGVENTILKHISEQYALGKLKIIKFIQRALVRQSLIKGLIATSILIVSHNLIAQHIFKRQELAIPIIIFSLMLVPDIISKIYTNSLKATQHIKASSAIDMALRKIIQTGLLLLLVPFFGLNGALYATITTSILVTLICIVYWGKSKISTKEVLDQPKLQNAILSDVKDSIRSFSSIALWYFLYVQSTKIILGIFCTNLDVSIFYNTERISSLCQFVFMSVTSFVTPKFRKLYTNKQYEEILIVFRHAIYITFVSSILLTIPIILFAKEIMSLYGQEFVQGKNTLIILTVAQLVSASTGPIGYLLSMTNNEENVRRSITLSSLLGLTANILLIPSIGIEGGAIGMLIFVVMSNLGCFYYAYKNFFKKYGLIQLSK